MGGWFWSSDISLCCKHVPLYVPTLCVCCTRNFGCWVFCLSTIAFVFFFPLLPSPGIPVGVLLPWGVIVVVPSPPWLLGTQLPLGIQVLIHVIIVKPFKVGKWFANIRPRKETLSDMVSDQC